MPPDIRFQLDKIERLYQNKIPDAKVPEYEKEWEEKLYFIKADA